MCDPRKEHPSSRQMSKKSSCDERHFVEEKQATTSTKIDASDRWVFLLIQTTMTDVVLSQRKANERSIEETSFVCRVGKSFIRVKFLITNNRSKSLNPRLILDLVASVDAMVPTDDD